MIDYILWNARVGGWLTQSSTYSSQLGEAKTFTRDDALAIVKAHLDAQRGIGLIPVVKADVDEVQAK